MLMTPCVEMTLLTEVMRIADELAEMGHPAIGYRLMDLRRRDAEDAALTGCPWAKEFIAAYCLAMEEYAGWQCLRVEEKASGKG